MALVLPILMLIVIGILKFGVLYNNYLQLTDAVRSGARQLAIERGQGDPCGDAGTQIGTSAAALNQTITATMNMSGDTTDNYQDVIAAAGGGTKTYTPSGTCPTLVSGSAATVKATYPCDLQIFGINFFSSCTLNASATERIE